MNNKLYSWIIKTMTGVAICALPVMANATDYNPGDVPGICVYEHTLAYSGTSDAITALWCVNPTTPVHGSCSLDSSTPGQCSYVTNCDTGYYVSGEAQTTNKKTVVNYSTALVDGANGCMTCSPRTTQVTLDKQSGTGGTTTITATYDAAMPTATMPTRTGYSFGGYYTETGCNGTQYYTAAGASARNWNSVSTSVLYACWSFDSYTCAAGTYLPANATTCTQCPAGSYCGGGTFAYGPNVQGIDTCTGRTKYSAVGASSCSTVSNGYYTTGCNTSGNGCTGQTQCTGTTYCEGGVQYDCPDANTHKRTSFPADFYSPTISSISVQSANGRKSITECKVSASLRSDRGISIDQATYNTSTNKYDNTTWHQWHQVNPGYYLTGKGSCGTYAYYTTANECPAGSYCPGKSSVTCNSSNQATVHTTNFGLEPCPANYSNSDSGANAITQCYSNTKSRAWTGSQAACAKPTGCSTATCDSCSIAACDYVAYSNANGDGDGTIKSGCETNNASCQPTVKSVTADTNHYVSGTTCPACSGLANGFYPNSAAGNTGGTGVCYTNNLSGQYVATVNASSATNCGDNNHYKSSHTVYYGGTSSCNTVDTGYYSTGGTETTRTGQTQCTAGYYCVAGVRDACVQGSYSSTSGATECIACGDYDSDENEFMGYTTAGSGATTCNVVCSNNSDDSVQTWIPATWNSDNTVTNLCTVSKCSKDHYKENNSCLSCSGIAGGLYPHSSNGTTKGSEACYLRTSEIPGYYIANAQDITPTPCDLGTYSAGSESTVVHFGETSKCKACAADTYADEVGMTACVACPEKYHTVGEKTSSSACRISCPAGTWLAHAGDTTCSDVGPGYWSDTSNVSLGDNGTRNACPVGMTTAGFGAGADEAGDCGRKLHFGDNVLYLRSTKKTIPAFNIRVGNQVFYANMTTDDTKMSYDASQKLKTNYEGSVWSVFDDTVSGGLALDYTLAATSIMPSAYNATGNGQTEWSATLSDGTELTGTARCSATTSTNANVSADGFVPEGSGTGCWCKLTEPGTSTKWVYATTHNSCSNVCNYMCANNMKTKEQFRANLYSVVGLSYTAAE